MGNCQSERQLKEQPETILKEVQRVRLSHQKPDSPSILNLGPALMKSNDGSEVSIHINDMQKKKRDHQPGGGIAEWNCELSTAYSELDRFTKSEYFDVPPVILPSIEAGTTWTRFSVIASGREFLKCSFGVDEESGLLHVVAIDKLNTEWDTINLEVGDRLILANGSTAKSLESVDAFIKSNLDMKIDCIFARLVTKQTVKGVQSGELSTTPTSRYDEDNEHSNGELAEEAYISDNNEIVDEGKIGEADPKDYVFYPQKRKNLFEISSLDRKYSKQYSNRQTSQSSIFRESAMFGSSSASTLRTARDSFLS